MSANQPCEAQAVSLPPPPRRRAEWCTRLVLLGTALGLGFGLLSQLALSTLAEGVLQVSPAQRVAAVLYSAACWAVVCLLLGVVTRSWLGWAPGRAAALVVSSGLLTLLSLLGILALAVRVLSGTYLTAGAVAFSLGSSEHFAHAAVGQYRGWLALFSALAVVLGLGFGRWLHPALRYRRARLPRGSAAVTVFAMVVIGLVFANRGANPFTRGMFRSTPMLALASSFGGGSAIAERFSVDQRTLADGGRVGGTIHAGPRIETEQIWRAAVEQRTDRGPNVLFVMLESISPDGPGYGGNPRAVTPEIDRLAAGGLRLRRAWAAATHSNYAQPAALSSQFPYRRTTLDLYHRLDYPRFLFHDLMVTLGYDTAIISSQDESWQGIARFQDTGTPIFHRHALDHPGPFIDTGTEKVVPDELTTDLALTWLTEPRDGPWALYVNFQTTHFPYTTPEGSHQRYQPSEPSAGSYTYVGYPEADYPVVRNRYDNALAYVDEQVGRLRDYLEHTGELDNTLWIITADHGEMFGDHGLVTHGRTVYDAEARVPLLLYWPGVIQPRDSHEPVSHLDILPTLTELLGVPPHPSFQGTSMLERVEPALPRSAIFMTIQGWRHADAVVCWPWKLIADRTNDKVLLFHLEQDPREMANLADAHPGTTARLGQLLDSQLRAQLDYYDSSNGPRQSHFAPELGRCPALASAP